MEDKTQEEREDDFKQLFDSILKRIQEDRIHPDEITITDSEIGKAIKDYCKTYKDTIIYKD